MIIVYVFFLWVNHHSIKMLFWRPMKSILLSVVIYMMMLSFVIYNVEIICLFN